MDGAEKCGYAERKVDIDITDKMISILSSPAHKKGKSVKAETGPALNSISTSESQAYHQIRLILKSYRILLSATRSPCVFSKGKFRRDCQPEEY